MKNPLLQKHANGWTVPVKGDQRYDGFYPEAVGGKWNPSDGKDLSSSYSKQCGGYFGKDDATQEVRNYIDKTYRASQDIWDRDKDSEKEKPETLKKLVREASAKPKLADTAIAAYYHLAMKFAAATVKTAAISVSQGQDADGTFMSVKMNGTEYEIRGEDAENFRREYAAIPKPEEKVNALVQKYLDKMQPSAIQMGVPPREERYGKPQQEAPAAAPAKEEKKPSRFKNWLLNRKEKDPYSHMTTLGLDGMPVPKAPEPEGETGIEKHFREEDLQKPEAPKAPAPAVEPEEEEPTPAPEAEEMNPPAKPRGEQPKFTPKQRPGKPVPKSKWRTKDRNNVRPNQSRVPVGRRRSSLEKEASEQLKVAMDKGWLVKVGSKYAVRSDADEATRSMVRQLNKAATE